MPTVPTTKRLPKRPYSKRFEGKRMENTPKLIPYRHRVQYYETDCMRVVHHSNYIRFFEEARVDFLAQIGADYAALEAAGYISPVLSVSADFKRMSVYGEDLYILVKLAAYKGARFTFTYQVIDTATGTLRATGETTHCFLKDGMPVHLKRELPEAYERLTNAVGLETSV